VRHRGKHIDSTIALTMPRRTVVLAAVAVAVAAPCVGALNNGVAITPPMGYQSYMAPLHDESGLGKIADFLVSTGLREKGYHFVNTDEGWELKVRLLAGRWGAARCLRVCDRG
jgi:hypothetical protein